MHILDNVAVLLLVLIALLVGFAVGRFSARVQRDPSDLNRMRRQADVSAALKASAPNPISASTASTPDQAGADMPPQVVVHIQNRRLIEAIKAYREAHPGVGLKQAKDAVEAYIRRNGL